MTGPAAEAPNRVLVRLPNWVGDVVMATPVLRALAHRFPEAEILAEGRPFLAGLVAGMPWVTRFLPDGGRGARHEWARGRALGALDIDWALLLPDSVRSAIGPRLARIPRRIGYARDPLRRALLTDALAPPSVNGKRVPVSMPERYLALTRHLGCPDAGDHVELALLPDAAAGVDARLAEHGLGPGAPADAGNGTTAGAAPGDPRFVVVSPGANFGSSKLYPPAQFAVACDLLHERFGLATVFAPGPGEEALAHDVAARMQSDAVVLADPVTSLAELVALTARATLALGNDTGPRHIAVALGVPAVVVMGPTDPRHTAYQLDRQAVLREDVDCSPCHKKICPIDHRCMTRLAPERIAAAAQELLS